MNRLIVREIIVIVLISLFISPVTGLASVARYTLINCREASCSSNTLFGTTSSVDYPNNHEDFTHVTMHHIRRIFRSSMNVAAGSAPAVPDSGGSLPDQTIKVASNTLPEIFTPPKHTL